jgi:hypothetical protein
VLVCSNTLQLLESLHCNFFKWKGICVRAGSNGDSSESDTMLAEFMQYVDATQQLWPLEGRKPTALMPPTAVVRVQVKFLLCPSVLISLRWTGSFQL